MGKTGAYVATAILLGIVAMLPVIVLTPKRGGEGYYAIDEDMRLLLKGDVESLQLQEEFGLAKVPLSPFNLGLILVISFAFASGVSVYFKRKIS